MRSRFLIALACLLATPVFALDHAGWKLADEAYSNGRIDDGNTLLKELNQLGYPFDENEAMNDG